jgi:2-polyprenyl-3-methyl-5-hydroxy-6-metoxy-1,4-benzoquinol methylase
MLGGIGGIGATDKGKPYAKHTQMEVEFIISETNPCRDSLIYDFGCGNGRHSIALAMKKYHVGAIDYLEENITIARKNMPLSCEKYAEFLVEDCRSFRFPVQADLIICLYDVIGSFSDENDNIKIIENIYANLIRGGTAIISVMNSEIGLSDVPSFSYRQNPNAIFNLQASNSMEKTGEVFNPKYLLRDNETGIFYRKEQFVQGRELPIELIVCDRRYSAEKISALCKNVGFEVEFVRHVHAGDWNTDLPPNNPHAKEILLKCKKV